MKTKIFLYLFSPRTIDVYFWKDKTKWNKNKNNGQYTALVCSHW
jgi:hypothetical protein